MIKLEIPSPQELNNLLDQLAMEFDQPLLLNRFRQRWQDAHVQFELNLAGELAYRDAWLYFQEQIQPLIRKQLPADSQARQAAMQIEAVFKPDVPAKRINRQKLAQLRLQRSIKTRPDRFQKPVRSKIPEFDRPIFIVSAPRAGSTLLFETLTQFTEVWSIGQESHDIEADISALHPQTYGYRSNRLTEAEVKPTVSEAVQNWFTRRLQNKVGQLYLSLPEAERPQSIRFVEKTPKNALRIPFLKAIFPSARFIYLHREAKQNISSMLEGWRTRRFVAYREIPNWPYKEWSFLLVPDWETLIDKPLVEIAAYQWRMANKVIQTDLHGLPDDSWCRVDYDDLINQPCETIKQISDFAGFIWTDEMAERLSQPLPVSHMAVSKPAPEKWRKHAAELALVLPTLFT